MSEGLTKQIEPPTVNAELAAMKQRIGLLQGLYVALFGLSLVLLVVQYGTRASASMNVAWACSLGAAVVVRLIRQSMVNKYNQRLMGNRPTPLT
jgi:hypothetical protein